MCHLWTTTEDLEAKGAKIEVTARDDYGNKAVKKAEGERFYQHRQSKRQLRQIVAEAQLQKIG